MPPKSKKAPTKRSTRKSGDAESPAAVDLINSIPPMNISKTIDNPMPRPQRGAASLAAFQISQSALGSNAKNNSTTSPSPSLNAIPSASSRQVILLTSDSRRKRTKPNHAAKDDVGTKAEDQANEGRAEISMAKDQQATDTNQIANLKVMTPSRDDLLLTTLLEIRDHVFSTRPIPTGSTTAVTATSASTMSSTASISAPIPSASSCSAAPSCTSAPPALNMTYSSCNSACNAGSMQSSALAAATSVWVPPKDVLKHVTEGRYIDIASLLDSLFVSHDTMSAFTTEKTLNEDEEVIQFVAKRPRRYPFITTCNQWMTAFSRLVIAISEASLLQAVPAWVLRDSMDYQQFISKLANSFLFIKVYNFDVLYRQSRQGWVFGRGWSQIDNAMLWAHMAPSLPTCSATNNSHESNASPRFNVIKRNTSNYMQSTVCYKWNKGDPCFTRPGEKCLRRHVCWLCGGDHRKSEHPTPSAKGASVATSGRTNGHQPSPN